MTATMLACPECGNGVNLVTMERLDCVAECDAIYSDGPRFSGWIDYSRGESVTVGVWCDECDWNYEGPDWLTKLVPYQEEKDDDD